MLKVQCFDSHLLQLPIHLTDFEALSTHRALFGGRIRRVLLVLVDAFRAEQHITFVAFHRLNRNTVADHAVESF